MASGKTEGYTAAMRKSLLIVVATVMGAGVQGGFFLLATHEYYAALPPLASYNNLMPGLGETVATGAGGLLGALGGAIAASFRGRASWWFPILNSAMLGAFMAVTEIGRAEHPAFAVVALTAAGGFAGWIVAYLGKKISGWTS